MSAVLQSELVPLADTGAPITLITGLPGSGKTLFSLAEFAVAKAQVFQHGIDGCVLPECDPDKWQGLAKGSTLIVDEAWKHFPPKNASSDPPLHYQVGEIRHTGVALVLITQHPNDLDARIRRRVGRHIHVVRVFGAEEAVIHQKNEVFDVEHRTDTITRRWVYPKKVYSLYKSAELHRAKEDKPWRYRMIPYLYALAPLLFIGGLAYMWLHTKGLSAAPSVGQRSASGTVVASRGPDKPQLSWFEQRKARMPGLEYTAPVYDDVTKPKDAPYPAACIESKSKGCTCFSQQGTRLEMAATLCHEVVAKGFFVDWQAAQAQPATPPGARVYVAPPEPAPWVAPQPGQEGQKAPGGASGASSPSQAGGGPFSSVQVMPPGR